MPNGTPFCTRFIDENGVDLGNQFVEKDYIIDVYPNLVGPFKQSALWLWGTGNSGRLGDNSIINRSSPVQTVSGGTNWKQVSLGSSHTAAIKTDGTLWMWGSGGSGVFGENIVISRSSPVQTVSGGTNWKQVSLGGAHAGAIKTDGTLWVWGSGVSGQLGINDRINRSSPIQTVSGGTNWKQVSMGASNTGAIKTDGTLWMWGCNVAGELGTNNLIFRSSPVQTVSGGTNWKQVSVGDQRTAAIKTDGTLWTWGCNVAGELGTNNLISRSSPVQTVSGGTNWKQVSVGGFLFILGHAAAIKTDGTLWVWGSGGDGQLGDNSTIDRSSPVQTISGGTNWKQVSLALNHTAAIKTDGTLWLWGSGESGKFGENIVINRSSPVQTVSGGTNWKQVSVGQVHTAAIREEGDW